MINELIGRVFAARNRAHTEHWKTTSYAAHMALGAFYDGVIDALDALVENYQGLYGSVTPETSSTAPGGDIPGYLQDEADWIESHRDEISNGSDCIGNLVDALTACYTKTIYLLTLR